MNMKVSNKLTDERLATLIENCFCKEDMDFADLSSFEAYSVAENALQLVEEEEFADADFSFDVSSFNYEPLAMCGFLGDDSEVDIDLEEDIEDEESDDKTS